MNSIMVAKAKCLGFKYGCQMISYEKKTETIPKIIGSHEISISE